MRGPAIDVAETESEYVVTVELPGCKREDVSLEVRGDVLSVRGEKRNERASRKEQALWMERRYGAFSRSLVLPPSAAGDRIAASFCDGVLAIEIPKREEAKPKQIAIR